MSLDGVRDVKVCSTQPEAGTGVPIEYVIHLDGPVSMHSEYIDVNTTPSNTGTWVFWFLHNVTLMRGAAVPEP